MSDRRQDIDEGDLVQLKSGGPTMSVQLLTAEAASCMWFDSDGRLQERTFRLTSLQKVESGDGVSGS